MRRGPSYDAIITAYRESALTSVALLKALAFNRDLSTQCRVDCLAAADALEDALALAAGKQPKEAA